jgi:hypothetical protein
MGSLPQLQPAELRTSERLVQCAMAAQQSTPIPTSTQVPTICVPGCLTARMR